MEAQEPESEPPDADHHRIANLFSKLDLDGDGRIRSEELVRALEVRGVKGAREEAMKIITSCDLDNSGDLSLHEFTEYMHNHERQLESIFQELDRNQDGLVDVNELMEAFAAMGHRVPREEVERMVERMVPHPKSGRPAITWPDWRDFLHLTPHSHSMDSILHYWRQNSLLDFGSDSTSIPKSDLEHVWGHLVAGGVAGTVSRTCTAPLDRVKVILQVHGKRVGGVHAALKGMLEEGGVISLWRGNLINVIKIAPESALKFTAYEQGKRFLKRRNGGRDLEMGERFIAGSLAGAFSQSVIYPLEVMKTRLALRRTEQSPFELIRRLPFNAYYRGYIPNLLGILPYAGIDLAVYETLKQFYSTTAQERQEPPTLLLLTCGMVSSACGQLASYPLALVRTRLQASQDGNMINTFKGILRGEGLIGLYRGLVPNFAKVAPAVSISYLVYERVRVRLGVEMS